MINNIKYENVENLALIPNIILKENKIRKRFIVNKKFVPGKLLTKFAKLRTGGSKNTFGTVLNHIKFGVENNNKKSPTIILNVQID